MFLPRSIMLNVRLFGPFYTLTKTITISFCNINYIINVLELVDYVKAKEPKDTEEVVVLRIF